MLGPVEDGLRPPLLAILAVLDPIEDWVCARLRVAAGRALRAPRQVLRAPAVGVGPETVLAASGFEDRWGVVEMLRIYVFVLEVIQRMGPVLKAIGRHDADLARQCRRALTSVALNCEEGRNRRGGNGRLRFETAMGSANEVRACIEVAVALGYIEAQPELVDALDRIARTLHRLMK